MGACALITTVAMRRFGNAAVGGAALLSLYEWIDLMSAEEDATAIHKMGTGGLSRTGTRSLFKGMQYATIALLLKGGVYPGPVLVALTVASAPLVTAGVMLFEEDSEPVLDANEEEIGRGAQFLLLVGLTYHPIEWESDDCPPPFAT